MASAQLKLWALASKNAKSTAPNTSISNVDTVAPSHCSSVGARHISVIRVTESPAETKLKSVKARASVTWGKLWKITRQTGKNTRLDATFAVHNCT